MEHRKNREQLISLSIWIVAMLACCTAPVVAAFSLDTHLYIGTKVLDDALDGSISLCAGSEVTSAPVDSLCARQYPVQASTLEALRTNPSAYLAGTMGPDVFPDFITSQVTVHPGVTHGWGTDQWLLHLLSNAQAPQDRAWVQGFFSHASSDIFAHSWVNHYAGGIFDLGLHSDGNEIELRHFLLERYIGDRTPKIWNRYATNPSAPHEFIADQLMLANPVSAQFKKAKGTQHIVAIEVLHENVNRLYEDALRISRTANDLGERALLPLNGAKSQLKLTEESLKVAHKLAEEAQGALRQRDQWIKQAEDQLERVAKVIDENPTLIVGWQQSINTNKLALDVVKGNLDALSRAVNEAQKALTAANNAIAGIDEKICEEAEKILGDLADIVCKANPQYQTRKAAIVVASETLEFHRRTLTTAQNTIKDLEKANDRLASTINEANTAITQAKLTQSLTKLGVTHHRDLRKVETDVVKNTSQALVDAQRAAAQAQEQVAKFEHDLKPVNDFFARYNPIVQFLQHWSADIRRASIAFSGASQTVSQNILSSREGNSVDPYVEWYKCWSPVLGAVPSEVQTTMCTAEAIYKELHNKLDSELTNAVNSLGSLGWLVAPNVKMQQEVEKKIRQPLENEVKRLVRHTSDEILTFLGNDQLADLIGYMTSRDRITDATLNHHYANDDSHKGLLEIPDVSLRVRQDAGLVAEGDMVNEDHLAPLYNAIVLSKLALLDASTLNNVYYDLARDHDAVATRRALYSTDAAPFNILLGAVRSIDGNHQWQTIGLPYPLKAGNDRDWPLRYAFGRPGRDKLQSGFVFWGDLQAREVVFKRLFHGPLSPGMEALPAIIASYPFPACRTHPFPFTTDAVGARLEYDHTCKLTSNDPDAKGMFPVLSLRQVRKSEMSALGPWELRVARNEIFARHGYRFGPPLLVEHFLKQSWYKPSDRPLGEILSQVTTIEWANIARIKTLERASNGKKSKLALRQ